jgi:hypothetical protein
MRLIVDTITVGYKGGNGLQQNMTDDGDGMGKKVYN